MNWHQLPREVGWLVALAVVAIALALCFGNKPGEPTGLGFCEIPPPAAVTIADEEAWALAGRLLPMLLAASWFLRLYAAQSQRLYRRWFGHRAANGAAGGQVS